MASMFPRWESGIKQGRTFDPMVRLFFLLKGV